MIIQKDMKRLDTFLQLDSNYYFAWLAILGIFYAEKKMAKKEDDHQVSASVTNE